MGKGCGSFGANNYSGSRVNIVMIMHVAVIILSMAMLLIGLSQ